MATTVTMVEPRLLQSFRLAMAALYSLPSSASAVPPQQHDTSNRGNPKEANDFLVEMQSRNVRRKILSLQQKQRDLQPPSSSKPPSAASPAAVVVSCSPRPIKFGSNMEDAEIIHMGSSWLAFLAVLCRMHFHDGTFVAHPPERLFAAQSVLHRARRNKLTDGIDLEIERDDIPKDIALQMYRNNDRDFISPMIHAYQHLVAQWNPFVAAVLASYHLPSLQPPPQTSAADAATATEWFYEERVKGEVMLLTLACVSYITACEPEATPQRGPILEALGSAIVTIALRIRYMDPSESTAVANATGESLVSMIRHTYKVVFDHAQLFHPDPNALGTALATTLGTIPDTILGNAGGARGRLSVDPRVLEAAVVELRQTGFVDLWNALRQVSSNSHDILSTLEQWTKFLCLPRALVDEISGILVAFLDSEQNKDRDVALRFVYSIFEGGGWTVEKVLSFGVGLSEYQIINQAGKRKQSSRSKRRQKEMISNKTSDNTAEHAHLEVMERGEVACRVAILSWPTLSSLLREAVTNAETTQRQVDGEGPIGCVATAAQMCLPFLLLNNTHAIASHQSAMIELFQNLTDALVHLCSSSNQEARRFALPPIYALNKAVISKSQQRPHEDPDPFVSDVMLQCLTQLALSCAYPRDYFADLCAESNFELEIYRNDIRDVIRALTGGEDDDVVASSDAGGGIPAPCLHLLHRVTQSLRDELVQNHQIPAETFIHTVSAMAKPLGKLAKEWRGNNSEASKMCLCHSVEIISILLDRITNLFREPPQIQLVLPLSRTLNMAAASFAPILSHMTMSDATRSLVSHVLPQVGKLSLVSLRYIPELATSEHLPHEILGTMRGPGGEDHVGALALMRLTVESEQLTALMVHAMAPQMKEFCAMHEYLKSVESWGESKSPKTTPKSRRILLGVMCRLEASSSGQAGASNMLSNLVHSIISSILSVDVNRLDERSFFMLCEAAFDLASLSSLLPPTFFDHGEKKACLETLVLGGVQGYRITNNHEGNEGAILQWNRLRGALFTFFLESARPDLNETTCAALRDLILAECGAVTHLLSMNNNGGHSAIFNDDVVSPDVVPAGVFLMSIAKQFLKPGCSVPLPHCTHALCQVSSSVTEILLHPASFSLDEEMASDPRCSIAEAWFSSLVALAKSPAALIGDRRVEELCTNSVITAVALIFTPNLDASKEDKAGGMSPDGPQTLAMMEFLSVFFALGPRTLALAADELARRFPVVAVQNGNGGASSATTGVTLLLSALFRAVQGALPPWVVENISTVFCNFYVALDKNLNVLAAAIQGSMELRAPTTIRGVESGKLFSGYAFDGISKIAKDNFLQEVLNVAQTDSPASWKRLKHCVKAACGGKKKDTDFRQKPGMTRWEFERI